MSHHQLSCDELQMVSGGDHYTPTPCLPLNPRGCPHSQPQGQCCCPLANHITLGLHPGSPVPPMQLLRGDVYFYNHAGHAKAHDNQHQPYPKGYQIEACTDKSSVMCISKTWCTLGGSWGGRTF